MAIFFATIPVAVTVIQLLGDYQTVTIILIQSRSVFNNMMEIVKAIKEQISQISSVDEVKKQKEQISSIEWQMKEIAGDPQWEAVGHLFTELDKLARLIKNVHGEMIQKL